MGVRVACAVSGGVDSAVTALLLKRKGFNVCGVHMVNWDYLEEIGRSCPAKRDEIDARKTCERLGIPFHVVNFCQEYWTEVFMYMIENYRLGRTVVSDVLCNQAIKFGHLYRYVSAALNCDFLATGHFARSSCGPFLENLSGSEKVHLLCAVDPIKDQTYFLSTLSQKQLKKTMFPLGGFMKPTVRKIAVEEGLKEVADKAESMGVCFIGKRKSFDHFIDEYLPPSRGPIRHIDTGATLSEHSGIHHFTIGKRVRIRAELFQSAVGIFVSSLDPVTQTVWVCEGSSHPSLFAREFVVSEPHWIADSPLSGSDFACVGFQCQRNHPAYKCVISRYSEEHLLVKPSNPVRAAAPGQVCAFYDGDECLGSGEIQRVLSTL
ncbi:hypothetical protein AB6A40_007984 [Gnathostoma spinigerum]|uniref:tRNA-5-taurinomethyluridine 2-sulfurtransferase n=1 Tax=Gnathostoma spinigerum TaxID=75299 RepID=A0ABD6EMT2_9BILA